MTSIDSLRQRQLAEAAPMSEQSSIMMYRNPLAPVERPNMAELAREIEGTISPASETGPSDPEPTKSDEPKNKKKRWVERIPESLREPLLLLIVYLILSTESVKLRAAQYITAINPDENGKVSMSGVVLYGLLLVTVYTGLKKLIL